MAGYIPFKLLQTFRKMKTNPTDNKIANFTECLVKMAKSGPEDCLLEYTLEWTKKVDRGGLFPLLEAAFLLFKNLEAKFRQVCLPVLTQPSSSTSGNTTKESMVSKFIDDEIIQFHWALLAVDIEGEDESNELLKKIVDLYLNIRSFSTIDTIMEKLKAKKQTNMKKGSSSNGKDYKKPGHY